MKLYIPEIGEAITLAADWRFTLIPESRNVDFIQEIERFKSQLPLLGSGAYGWDYDLDTKIPASLPKGTPLVVDRIYIRKGAADFSSLTFTMKVTEEIRKHLGYAGNKKSFRFWVKLAEVNQLEFDAKAVQGPPPSHQYACEVVYYYSKDTIKERASWGSWGCGKPMATCTVTITTSSPEKAKKGILAKARTEFKKTRYIADESAPKSPAEYPFKGGRYYHVYEKAIVRLSQIHPSMKDHIMERKD